MKKLENVGQLSCWGIIKFQCSSIFLSHWLRSLRLMKRMSRARHRGSSARCEGAARLDAQGEVLTCGVSTDESRRFSGRVMILSGFRGFRSHFKIEIDVLQFHTISHDLLRPDRPLSRICGLPALVQCGLSSRNSSATHDMSACGVRALRQELGCFAENLPLDGMAATCDWQDFPHGHVWACQQAWKEN